MRNAALFYFLCVVCVIVRAVHSESKTRFESRQSYGTVVELVVGRSDDLDRWMDLEGSGLYYLILCINHKLIIIYHNS